LQPDLPGKSSIQVRELSAAKVQVARSARLQARGCARLVPKVAWNTALGCSTIE
jgi:hypothetical protein